MCGTGYAPLAAAVRGALPGSLRSAAHAVPCTARILALLRYRLTEWEQRVRNERASGYQSHSHAALRPFCNPHRGLTAPAPRPARRAYSATGRRWRRGRRPAATARRTRRLWTSWRQPAARRHAPPDDRRLVRSCINPSASAVHTWQDCRPGWQTPSEHRHARSGWRQRRSCGAEYRRYESLTDGVRLSRPAPHLGARTRRMWPGPCARTSSCVDYVDLAGQ